VETQLAGIVEFDWRHDGLQCAIRVPSRPKMELLDNFADSVRNSSTRYSDPLEAERRIQIPLVEDESLIGMMMNQTVGNSTSTW